MNRLLFLIIILVVAFPRAQVVSAYDADSGQLLRFAESRKETASLLDPDAEFYKFLEKAFAGVYTSVPLRWDADEPQGNAYAENTPNDERTYIIIRVSAKLSPYDQIAALVYECMNAQNEDAFAQYIKDAYFGLLTKKEFIYRILRLEHLKLKQVRAFLSPQKPFSELDISKTEFYRKMLHTPEDFEAFIAYLQEIKRPEYDVFDMYSKFYDFITVTPETRKAQLDEEEKNVRAAEAEIKEIPLDKVRNEQGF